MSAVPSDVIFKIESASKGLIVINMVEEDEEKEEESSEESDDEEEVVDDTPLTNMQWSDSHFSDTDTETESGNKSECQ